MNHITSHLDTLSLLHQIYHQNYRWHYFLSVLTKKDYFMALLDLEEYIEAKRALLARYEDRMGWARMMLVNIAKAGYFSSDRTIAQYNEEIWRL